MFAGVAAGIATLAADARSEITSSGADVSLYKPENGPALNIFVGSHVHEYLTVQGNYVWNRNDVTLTSVRATDSGPSFYDAPRASSQHAFIGDLLVYFRERRSAIRPYLSAGVGVVRFQTTARGGDRVRNATLPPATPANIRGRDCASATLQTRTKRSVAPMDVRIMRGSRASRAL